MHKAYGLRAPILDHTENLRHLVLLKGPFSMACECAYKAGTFLVCRKSAPPAPLCLHRACPCPTLADTHLVQIQTQQHRQIQASGRECYVIAKVEEREGGCCVFVCLRGRLLCVCVFAQTGPPPMAAFQTLPEESSEPFRCLRRIWENETVNKSQSSQQLFLNSEVSAVFPKISLCQQSIHVHVASRILSVFI